MSIPENLLIIGTMNTSDRNLSTVDHAIRRRFTFIHAPADPAVVRTYHSEDNEQYYNCYVELIEAMKQNDSFQAGVMIQDLHWPHLLFDKERGRILPQPRLSGVAADRRIPRRRCPHRNRQRKVSQGHFRPLAKLSESSRYGAVKSKHGVKNGC